MPAHPGRSAPAEPGTAQGSWSRATPPARRARGETRAPATLVEAISARSRTRVRFPPSPLVQVEPTIQDVPANPARFERDLLRQGRHRLQGFPRERARSSRRRVADRRLQQVAGQSQCGLVRDQDMLASVDDCESPSSRDRGGRVSSLAGVSSSDADGPAPLRRQKHCESVRGAQPGAESDRGSPWRGATTHVVVGRVSCRPFSGGRPLCLRYGIAAA
jgi:hypothetical protein